MYFDNNLDKIQKAVLTMEDTAVRDVIIAGPLDSIHIDTRNSSVMCDVTREVIDNCKTLGINLEAQIETKIETIDTAFYQITITNIKKEERKTMNTLLKAGEREAFIKNFKEGKVVNNTIFLNKTNNVLLRTNGSVIYGLYKVGESKYIEFTHSSKYTLPYIGSGYETIEGKRSYFRVEYSEYKQVVLDAWKRAYTKEAALKHREVMKLAAELCNANINTEEKKEEVKEMNKELTVNTNEELELNVMALAHAIRKQLNLEGHYHAQMKIALSIAWKQKRSGEKVSIDIKVETTAEAPTYKAEEQVSTPEQEAAVTITEDKEPAPAPEGQEIYLHTFDLTKGIAQFHRKCNGVSAPFGPVFKVRNIRDLDKQFSAFMPKILAAAPNNTTIMYYGDFTRLARYTPGNKELGDSKGITMTAGVAPSGKAV